MEKCYGEYHVSRLDEEISKELCERLSEDITDLITTFINAVEKLDNPKVRNFEVFIKPRAHLVDMPFPNVADHSDEITLGYKFFADTKE